MVAHLCLAFGIHPATICYLNQLTIRSTTSKHLQPRQSRNGFCLSPLQTPTHCRQRPATIPFVLLVPVHPPIHMAFKRLSLQEVADPQHHLGVYPARVRSHGCGAARDVRSIAALLSIFRRTLLIQPRYILADIPHRVFERSQLRNYHLWHRRAPRIPVNHFALHLLVTNTAEGSPH